MKDFRKEIECSARQARQDALFRAFVLALLALGFLAGLAFARLAFGGAP